MRRLGGFHITTFQIIVFGFLGLILVGTLLLMCPISTYAPGGATLGDSLFTATSAVCVTGLVVRDTATYWSPFGQAVILSLIQVGGMGVVTVAVAIFYVSGRRIGLMQRSTMQEAISAPQVGGIVRLTGFIFRVTAAIELIGAVLPGAGIWARGMLCAVSLHLCLLQRWVRPDGRPGTVFLPDRFSG